MDEGTDRRMGVHDMVIEVDTGLSLDGEEAFKEIPRLDPPDDRRALARLLLLLLLSPPLVPLTVTLTILLRSLILRRLPIKSNLLITHFSLFFSPPSFLLLSSS